MNRENVLFSAVGLLLGYVIAFHLVVYVNQSHQAEAAAAAPDSAAQGLPADHPQVAGGACARADAKQVRQRPDNNAALRRSVRRPVLIVFVGSVCRRLRLRARARLAQFFAQERELRVARVGLLKARERRLGLGELLRLHEHEREVVQAVDVVRLRP